DRTAHVVAWRRMTPMTTDAEFTHRVHVNSAVSVPGGVLLRPLRFRHGSVKHGLSPSAAAGWLHLVHQVGGHVSQSLHSVHGLLANAGGHALHALHRATAGLGCPLRRFPADGGCALHGALAAGDALA